MTLDQAKAICEANGFAVVPIYPTDKMCDAGVIYCGDGHYPDFVYKAMLEAAKEVKP